MKHMEQVEKPEISKSFDERDKVFLNTPHNQRVKHEWNRFLKKLDRTNRVKAKPYGKHPDFEDPETPVIISKPSLIKAYGLQKRVKEYESQVVEDDDPALKIKFWKETEIWEQ